MNARLLAAEGNVVVELQKPLTLIGRNAGCDYSIEMRGVSKMHCVLLKNGETLELRDLGSTNGTRVNGKRIRRATLRTNDVLHIANVAFRVQIGSQRLRGGNAEQTQQISSQDLPQEPPPKPPGNGPAVRKNLLPDQYADDPDRKN